MPRSTVQAGLARQLERRLDADAEHDQVGRQPLVAARQGDGVGLDRGDGLPEVEADAVLLVRGAQHAAQLGAERALERHRLRRDDVNLEAARAQRRRDLHADEAGAHHDRAARACGALDDRAAVAQRAQRQHVRLVAAGQRRTHRLGAGRQQQRVPADLAPVRERQLVAGGIDADDARAERDGDLLLAEKCGRAQRHPFLGGGARQVVLRQVGAVDRGRLIRPEQQDLAVVALAAQRLRG